MDNLDFSEEEIQEQLAILGYKNIPKHRLREFKQDLDDLIQHGEWKSLTSPTPINSTVNGQTASSRPSPPAFTKEKVSQHYFEESSEGFFLHAGKVDCDRQVLTTYQNGDYTRCQQGPCDSYAQHSVAPKLQLPPGAPRSLQVEPDPDDTLNSPLTDSYSSTTDTQERRFIKRKVLRKHKGQSLVCDESVYSEDSALCLHRSHTSAGVYVATMYKMYNAQWDGDSDDDKNSLSSSFWSDGEREEEEEAAVAIDSKPVADTEDSFQEGSEEEKPELKKQGNISLESESNNDDDDEESCSSSSDSPAPSLMTSGYGTYRPEEQEGGDYRDDHTVTEFDQDSRGDLSEMRDDEEDDRSLCSFGVEPTEPEYGATRQQSVSADAEPEANVACCGGEGLHEQVGVTGVKPEDDQDQADEEEQEEDFHGASEHEVTDAASEEQQHAAVVEGGSVDVDKVESEDPDDSSSNKDIKFIDSKVNFSQMTFKKMCEEWEGNLRQKKDAASCLDERLAELHLSSTAQRDFEAENEDVTSQSDAQSSESEGISLSAFESYIRGMTRARSEGDLRPKPKSFIRPVMSQQTIKKTDPVAKYFQYKQLWEMFKLPGEKDRRDLRWEIKERLAYQPPPPKPHRVYVPNTYTVPTAKKRSALRWEIRNDLANGLLPHKFSYRF